MDDFDTATIELTEGEARAVIDALSDSKPEAPGRGETGALAVRDLLQREFGFEDSHFEDDGRFVPAFGDVLEWDGDDEVQLSRAEVAAVAAALADGSDRVARRAYSSTRASAPASSSMTCITPELSSRSIPFWTIDL